MEQRLKKNALMQLQVSLPDYAEVVKIYESSFPENERTRMWLLRL